MANIYKVRIDAYADEDFTQLRRSDEINLSVVFGTGAVPETTVVSDSTSMDYFQPYIVSGDFIFLGGAVETPGFSGNQGLPHKFFPLAQDVVYGWDNQTQTYLPTWIEMTFVTSGVRLHDPTNIYAGSTSSITAYDKNGNIINSSSTYRVLWGHIQNGSEICNALVFNGTYDDTNGYDGDFCTFNLWQSRWGEHSIGERISTFPEMNELFNYVGLPDAISDPYSPGGDSTTGGGGGTWGDLSDTIDFPSLPTLSAIGTGFVTLYIPTAVQLSNLANYMWNGDVQTLDFWRKIVADPIDLILGLNIIPVALPSAGGKNVTVGGVSTDVYMTYTSTQYVEIDCGSLSVPEFYGAYLDYAPYTKFDLYLPYCGTHPLIADEIVGKTIHIKYHVDALSGACVAYVKCGDSVLYEFAGNVCAQIPVTANQFGDMVRSAISIASAIGTMVATDGATTPMAVGAIASAGTNSTGLKPTVEKSGAIGGMAGQLGIQKPYLIITRPSLCIPKNQNIFVGYPSFVTVLLNDLRGYNEISSIHIENVPATDTELSEIESLLKGGVIF